VRGQRARLLRRSAVRTETGRLRLLKAWEYRYAKKSWTRKGRYCVPRKDFGQ